MTVDDVLLQIWASYHDAIAHAVACCGMGDWLLPTSLHTSDFMLPTSYTQGVALCFQIPPRWG